MGFKWRAIDHQPLKLPLFSPCRIYTRSKLNMTTYMCLSILWCLFPVETLKQPSTPNKDLNQTEEEEQEVFVTESTPNDYPFLLMGCLRLLLESNAENAKVFRECGGARCAHNMIPYPNSRTDALRIIHELILNGGSDDLGRYTLCNSIHSTPCQKSFFGWGDFKT